MQVYHDSRRHEATLRTAPRAAGGSAEAALTYEEAEVLLQQLAASIAGNSDAVLAAS